MRMGMSTAWVCGLVMAGGAWADPVEIKAALPEGRTIALQVTYDLSVQQQTPDGPSAGKAIRQEALIRFVVQGVAEDGTAALRGDVERLTMVWERGDERGEFVKPRITADVPAETALNGAIAAIGEAILSAPIEMAVAPDGRVEAIRGLNDVLMEFNSPAVRGAGDVPLLDMSALGIFGSRQFAAMAGSAFTADSAGFEARSVGDAWETTEAIPSPPVGTVTLETDWTLEKVEGDVATLKGVPTMAIMPPQADDPTAPKGEVTEQEGAITMVWDLGEDALVSREATQRVKTTWTLVGMSLTQEQRVAMTIRRVE